MRGLIQHLQRLWLGQRHVPIVRHFTLLYLFAPPACENNVSRNPVHILRSFTISDGFAAAGRLSQIKFEGAPTYANCTCLAPSSGDKSFSGANENVQIGSDVSALGLPTYPWGVLWIVWPQVDGITADQQHDVSFS